MAGTVEHEGQKAHQRGQHKAHSHTHVPRWFRMAFRTCVMMFMISFPVVAMREPSFQVPAKYQAFSALFIVCAKIDCIPASTSSGVTASYIADPRLHHAPTMGALCGQFVLGFHSYNTT